jgi:Flp pilus assembly protein TadG
MRRGAAMTETAIVFAVLFPPLVIGMIEAARMCMVNQMLANAAREGCRVAVMQATGSSAGATTALGTVNTRITTMLNGTGINPGSLQAVSSDPGTAGAYIMPTNWSSVSNGSLALGAPITVVLRVPFSSVDWLANPFILSSSLKITAYATMAKQYAPELPPGN